MRITLLVSLLSGCGSDSGPTNCGADNTFDGDECVFPGAPGPTGFPDANNSNDDARGFGICNPRQQGPCDDLSTSQEEMRLTCCSDDPAAVGGALPDFAGRGGGAGFGTPYFAGVNNAVGISGMCVDTASVVGGLTDTGAQGCPVPCNPTWSADDVAMVCGAARVCCQTRLLEAADCLIGEDGNLRPATGEDVVAGRSDWSPARHATHQDPNGTGCASLTGTAAGDEFTACVEQLTVADQRGLCVEATACPTIDAPC